MSDAEKEDHAEPQEKVQKTEKKLLVPDTNILQISSKKGHRFYIFLSKIFLKTFDDIELHALGQATGMCARLGESLQREGLANITNIETSTFVPKESLKGPRRSKKIKMIVKVHRSDGFEDLVGDDLKVAKK